MKKITFVFLVTIFLLSGVFHVSADVFVNILAVNGSDENKEKEIKQYLPIDLKKEDIIDAGGLTIVYDPSQETHFVTGMVKLKPKESRTIKIRVKDIWVLDQDQIDEVKKQIDLNSQRTKGSEFEEVAQIKEASLLQRLDYITQQQESSIGNVDKRMSLYRTYKDEMEDIRRKALSVKYWRSKPPSVEDAEVYNLILEAENPSSLNAVTKEQKHYLPTEVKPEHVIDLGGFKMLYDAVQALPYLSREEELQPKEVKRYKVGLIDVWRILQDELNNLRTRKELAFEKIKDSDYLDTAEYLVESIEKNLVRIEESQAQEKGIQEHISSFRENTEILEAIKADLLTMEELMDELEAKVNIESLTELYQKTVVAIAKGLFGDGGEQDKSWKYISWVLFGIGGLTGINYLWGFISRAGRFKRKR